MTRLKSPVAMKASRLASSAARSSLDRDGLFGARARAFATEAGVATTAAGVTGLGPLAGPATNAFSLSTAPTGICGIDAAADTDAAWRRALREDLKCAICEE